MEGWVTIGIAVIILVVGVVQLVQYNRLRRTGTEAEGVVFDVETDTQNGATSYYPVIRFVTDKQEWITKKATVSGVYKPGDKVTVVYHPDNPSEFFIRSGNTYTVIIIIILAGILFLAVGCYLVLNGGW